MNKEMELLRIFRVAAESSSFRDAAVRLGTSPQGVTRAVQQLEQHYGEVLFHRSTRQVRITAFGEGLLDQVRPALERFEDLWRTPGSDQQASLSGTVRITAPHSLGTRAVLPALERVAARLSIPAVPGLGTSRRDASGHLPHPLSSPTMPTWKWERRWPGSRSRNWRTTWPPPTLPAGSSCECWRTKNLRRGGCTSIGLSVAPFREGFERYLMKC